MDVDDFNLCNVEGLPDEIKKALGCGTVVNIRDYFKGLPDPVPKKCFGNPMANATTTIVFPDTGNDVNDEFKNENKDFNKIFKLLENTSLYNYVLRIVPPRNSGKLQLVIGKYDVKRYIELIKKPGQFETHQGIKHGQLLNQGIVYNKDPSMQPKLIFSGTLIQVKENEKYTILINPMSGCWENNKLSLQEKLGKHDLDLFNVTCMSHILKTKINTDLLSNVTLKPCDVIDILTKTIGKEETRNLDKCLLGIPEILDSTN